MFTIRLQLCGERLSGLEAVDECRRLGLPDSSELYFAEHDWRQTGAVTPKLEVAEPFARAYFAPQQTDSTASVPRRLLTRGDLFPISCNPAAVTFGEIAPERIRELYLAVRFAGLEAEVARLTAERDALRERLDETEPEEAEDEIDE